MKQKVQGTIKPNRFCALFTVKSFVYVLINYLEVLYFKVIYYLIIKKFHVSWVPCHYGMARPQVADGDVLQIWRVAANILNKQSRTADKGWSSSLGVGCGANNSSP
jgi:hypothetical protein